MVRESVGCFQKWGRKEKSREKKGYTSKATGVKGQCLGWVNHQAIVFAAQKLTAAFHEAAQKKAKQEALAAEHKMEEKSVKKVSVNPRIRC